MTTHIAIYKGKAMQVESRAAAPTTRENPEYKVGNSGDLTNGDWYFNTVTSKLSIYVGSSWYGITLA